MIWYIVICSYRWRKIALDFFATTICFPDIFTFSVECAGSGEDEIVDTLEQEPFGSCVSAGGSDDRALNMDGHFTFAWTGKNNWTSQKLSFRN